MNRIGLEEQIKGVPVAMEICLTESNRGLESESKAQGCDMEAQLFKAGVPYVLASFDGIAGVQRRTSCS